MAHPQIAIFARMAKGGDTPSRLIYGQATRLSRTMHDIRYNEKRDEIYVGNPFAQSILTFRGGANGQEAPIRVIQGTKTRLRNPDLLEIDVVNNEIIVTEGDEVLVYSLRANGNVAPLRILQGGPKMGWRTGGGVAVDPVHNLLVIDGTILDEGQWMSPYRTGRESILIFDRTANGEVKPLRVIRGPKTGIHSIRQMQVYPKKGWIVGAQITDGAAPEPEGTFVGVWSINDNGDVPPRWKIEAAGKPGNLMKKPRGVALNPNHQELLVADMRLNAVLTFYFPEIF